MTWHRVLALDGLRIDVRPRPSYLDRWVDCRVAVTARPFAGVLETVFTGEDLVLFADALDGLDPAGVGSAVLGGDRAAEVRLVVEAQVGGGAARGELAVECTVTPIGDDPYPSLRFLVFGVRPFAAATAATLRRLAAAPWPRPGGLPKP